MYQKTPNTIGRMRYRIDVQSRTVADAIGSPSVTYATRFTGEPADFEYPRGGMVNRGRQIEEGVDAIFTVRHREGYVPTDRVVFESQNYGIVFIRPVRGRRDYIELHCKAVVT